MAVILVRNFIENPRLFIQIVLTGLQLGFVYALIALGYTMVYGIVRLINFAHGDVFMVGSLVSFFAVSRFSMHLWIRNTAPDLPEWLSTVAGAVSVIVLSMAVCAILGAWVVLKYGGQARRFKAVGAEARRLQDEALLETRRLNADIQRAEGQSLLKVGLVNAVILKKSFRWTALFAELEKALPSCGRYRASR